MSGFENEEHIVEFLAALTEKSIPLKFAYTGSAAFTHDTLARQASYKEVVGSTDLEVSALCQAALPQSFPTHMCDVGPGNGLHSSLLIERLLAEGYPLKKYLALDFSSTLLGICAVEFGKRFPELELVSATWDFETGPTSAISQWRGITPVLVLLTGHTLGNPEDPPGVLRNISASCASGDYFLIGVALMTKGIQEEALLSTYRNEMFKAAALEPLRMAGIPVDQGEFSLHFSGELNAIVGIFTCGAPVTVEHGPALVTLARGEQVRCFISRRFNDDEVKAMLGDAGWEVLSTSYDDAGAHGVYLTMKT